MRLILDTNIYIAAYLETGLASGILLKGKTGKLDIYISDKILIELKEKLTKKFKVEEYELAEFLDLIDKSASLVVPQNSLSVVKADPDDNKILECAVEAGADMIISMDKHLLKLKMYEGIAIVHPKTLTWILPKLF